MRELSFAWYDLWRVKRIAFILIVELITAIVFSYFTFDLMVTAAGNYYSMKRVGEMNIVQFSVKHSRWTPAVSDLTEKLLDNKEGFVFIPMPNANVVFAFGAYNEVYPLTGNLLTDSVEKPFCLAGSSIHAGNDSFLELGDSQKISIPIAASLDKNAKYFSGITEESLDDSYIVFMDYRQYMEFFYARDFIENLSLVNPPPEALRHVITVFWSEGIEFELRAINEYAGQYFKSILEVGIVFSLLLLAGLVFILSHIFAALSGMIDSNMREFSIHLVCGARFSHIYIRCCIVVFILCHFPLIIHAYVLPASMTGGADRIHVFFVCAFIVSAILPILALRKLRSSDAADYFERNE